MAKPNVKLSGLSFEAGSIADGDDDGVTYTDRAGNVLKFRLVDGVNISYFFNLSLIHRVRDFQFRSDDVYLPGYLRTGTNWTNEMLGMLLQGKAETLPEFKPHIEMVPDELNKRASPRVINAHMPMSRCPHDLTKKKCKIVYTLRDPKDVVVSLFKLQSSSPQMDFAYRGTFEGYFYFFLENKVDFNGYIQHWKDMEVFAEENPDIPVYYQIYEKALQNPLESVQKLSDFLGLPRNDDLCKEISDKCQFSNMVVDKRPHSLIIDGKNNIYRTGKIGDWRNYFTAEMIDDFYKVYDEKLSRSRFYNLYAREK